MTVKFEYERFHTNKHQETQDTGVVVHTEVMYPYTMDLRPFEREYNIRGGERREGGGKKEGVYPIAIKYPGDDYETNVPVVRSIEVH